MNRETLDDAEVLARVRSLNDAGEQRNLLASIWNEQMPMLRKARWAYAHYCDITGRSACAPEFVQEHARCWQDCILSIANRAEPVSFPSVDAGHTLFLGWHFPEWPRLASFVRKLQFVVLVADEGAIIRDLLPAENVLNFRAKGAFRLLREMRSGRPVYAMMDYVYPETHAITAPFLGYPVRTPGGLFALAARHRYRIAFLRPSGDTVQIADVLDPARHSVESCAEWTNALLEQAILCSPARWLLWCSLPNRWIGAPC